MHIFTKGEHVPIIERSVQKCLNSFPPLDSLDEPSPAMLVHGDDKPNYKTKRVPFGTYVIAYTGTDNTMDKRSVPAIALQQSNEFGGYL